MTRAGPRRLCGAHCSPNSASSASRMRLARRVSSSVSPTINASAGRLRRPPSRLGGGGADDLQPGVARVVLPAPRIQRCIVRRAQVGFASKSSKVIRGAPFILCTTPRYALWLPARQRQVWRRSAPQQVRVARSRVFNLTCHRRGLTRRSTRLDRSLTRRANRPAMGQHQRLQRHLHHQISRVRRKL